MFKNVSGQKYRVFAFDSATGLPKGSDAANITAYISKDYGTVTVLGDTSATEEDATNAKGYYLFDGTQTETNADVIMVSGKSSTTGIVVVGAPAIIATFPTTGFLAPVTAGRTLVVDANGLADANAVKVGPTGAGTAQTARDIGASVLLSTGTGTGQLDFTSGVVKANATQWLGGTIPAVNVTGVPKVDIVDWLGTAPLALTSQQVQAVVPPTQKVDIETIKTSAVVCSGTVTVPAATLASTTNITAGTITTASSVTTVNGLAANVITAASIAVDADTEIAAAVWDLATSGHTTSGTFGAAMNAAGSAGDPWSTSLPGAYGAGTAGFIVGTNLNGTVTSRMATYTQPTGFLSATFPAGTIANTTNITAGTISTVTNQLTAAQIATGLWQDATAGDFTVVGSIGKSLYTAGVVPGGTGGLFIAGTNAATTVTTAFTATFTGNLTGSVASVSGAVGSVTGNVGGNVTGSVGSVATGGIVTATFGAGATIPRVTLADSLATNSDKTGYSLNLAQVIGNSQTAGTVGDALLAAECQGFGKWTIVGTTLTIYRHDGIASGRVFTLDSATTPTSRT